MKTIKRVWAHPIEAVRTLGLVATLAASAWLELEAIVWLANMVRG